MIGHYHQWWLQIAVVNLHVFDDEHIALNQTLKGAGAQDSSIYRVFPRIGMWLEGRSMSEADGSCWGGGSSFPGVGGYIDTWQTLFVHH